MESDTDIKEPNAAELDQALGELMRMVQEDASPEAYRRLLGETQLPLLKFVQDHLPGEGDLVVREILISIHQKRHTYDPSRSFTAWMLAIAQYRVSRRTVKKVKKESDDGA